MQFTEEQRQAAAEFAQRRMASSTPQATAQNAPAPASQQRQSMGFGRTVGNIAKTIYNEVVGKPLTSFVGQGMNALNAGAIALSQPYLQSRGYSKQQIANTMRDELTKRRRTAMIGRVDPIEVVREYDPEKTALQNFGQDTANIFGTGLQLGSLIAPSGAVGAIKAGAPVLRTALKSGLTEGALSAIGEFGYRLSGEEDANIAQAGAFGFGIGSAIPLLGRAGRAVRGSRKALEAAGKAVDPAVTSAKYVEKNIGSAPMRFQIFNQGIDVKKVEKLNKEILELPEKIQTSKTKADELLQQMSSRKKAESKRLFDTYKENARILAEEKIPVARAKAEEAFNKSASRLFDTKGASKVKRYQSSLSRVAKQALQLGPAVSRVVANTLEQIPRLSARSSTETLLTTAETLRAAVQSMPRTADDAIKASMEKIASQFEDLATKKNALANVENEVRTKFAEEAVARARSAEDKFASKIQREIDKELANVKAYTQRRNEILNDDDYLFALGIAENAEALNTLIEKGALRKNVVLSEQDIAGLDGLKDIGTKFNKFTGMKTATVDPFRAADLMSRDSGSRVLHKALQQSLEIDNLRIAADDEAAKLVQGMAEKADADTMSYGVVRKNFGNEFPRKLQNSGKLFDALNTGSVDALDEGQRQVVEEMRAYLDTMFETLNFWRAVDGLPPVDYRKNYITHMEKASAMDRLLLSGDDADLLSKDLFGDVDPKLKTAATPMANERKGAILDPEKDVQYLMTTYARYVNRYVASVQGKQLWEPLIDEMRKRKLGQGVSYWTRFVNEGLGGKDTQLDLAFSNVAKVFATGTSMVSRGMLLGNFNTILNQFSGVGLTFAKGSLKDALTSFDIMFNKEMRNFVLANSKVVRGRMLEGNINRIRPGSKATKIAQEVLNETDRLVVMHSFATEFRRLKRAGFPTAEAIDLADEFTAKTQALYSRAFVSPLLRTKLARPLTQYQTWTFNMFRSMTTDIATKYKQEGLRGAGRDTVKLIAAMMTTNAIYQAAGLGKPFDDTPGGYIPMSGTIDIFAGGEGNVNPFGPPPLMRMLEDFMTIIFGSPSERTDAVENLPKYAARFIPGGGQAYKTFEGLNTIGRGYVQIGNTRIKVDNPRQFLQAILFGKSGISEVRAEYERLDRQERNK